MTTVAFDPRMGASGDMLLGALLDAGADRDALSPISDTLDIEFNVEEIVVQGISATRVAVHHGGGHDHSEGGGPHRTLAEVIEVLETLGLNSSLDETAIEIFHLLAEAEAAVHGTSIEETHFHEVGADDAIADVTGTLALLEDLDVDRVLTVGIAVGDGEVETSHGIYPVPPPAVAEIAARSHLNIYGGPVSAELLTPTGAAILGVIAETVDTLPPLRIDSVGYGAGQRSFEARPNVLRAMVAEPEPALRQESISVLETSVDDITPEILGHLQTSLKSSGALDISILPLTMKKSRPGHLIQVITRPADEGRVVRTLAEETGTLGIRSVSSAHRWTTERKLASVAIDVEGDSHEVGVKIATDQEGTVLDISAEFDDAASIATETDVPVRSIMRKAEAVGWNRFGE